MSPSDFYEEKKWQKILFDLDKKTERRVKNVKGLKAAQRGTF